MEVTFSTFATILSFWQAEPYKKYSGYAESYSYHHRYIVDIAVFSPKRVLYGVFTVLCGYRCLLFFFLPEILNLGFYLFYKEKKRSKRKETLLLL
jgi:hypothetical protein